LASKYSALTDKQQKKRHEWSNLVITILMHQYRNTDCYGQIFAASILLWTKLC